MSMSIYIYFQNQTNVKNHQIPGMHGRQGTHIKFLICFFYGCSMILSTHFVFFFCVAIFIAPLTWIWMGTWKHITQKDYDMGNAWLE